MCRRFEKEQTWTDPLTGLEWQCQSPGEMAWHDAVEYAGSLTFIGHCKTA